MDRGPAVLIVAAEPFQFKIERFEALAFGRWPEHVVLDKAVGALDAAFLVAFGWRRELPFERKPAAERAERVTAVLALSKTPTRGTPPK